MNVVFPRIIGTNKKGIEFICYLWGVCKKVKEKEIVWDCTNTTNIHTNTLSAIGLILKRMKSRRNKVLLKIKYKHKSPEIISEGIMETLFHKYSDKTAEGLSYFLWDHEKEEDVIEDYLNITFKEIGLKNYSKLKILISEMSANIKMHAEPSEGSICSYVHLKDKNLYISICNFGMTIKQRVEKTNEYNFIDDGSAIVWALKRHNTTRKEETSGGLGLYLLRKYTSYIDGQADIVSGKCMINLEEDFYRELNENEFLYKEEGLKSFFPGVMITIKTKYELLEGKKNNREKIIGELNLSDI